jgi:ActR/RegA family two-component response regulator
VLVGHVSIYISIYKGCAYLYMKDVILIVEDESKIARFLELELKHEGYDVEIAYDGRG